MLYRCANVNTWSLVFAPLKVGKSFCTTANNNQQLLSLSRHRRSRSTTWFIVHKLFILVRLMYSMPINFNQWQLSFKCRWPHGGSGQWQASVSFRLLHFKRSSRLYGKWHKYFQNSWSEILKHLPKHQNRLLNHITVVAGEVNMNRAKVKHNSVTFNNMFSP